MLVCTVWVALPWLLTSGEEEAFLTPPWVDTEAPRATPLVRDEKEEEAEAAEGTNVLPQGLRDPVEQCCRQTSINSEAQSETRSAEPMCLRWDDRHSSGTPIRKPQKRLQIGLGREEIRAAVDARTLRAFKSDAV